MKYLYQLVPMVVICLIWSSMAGVLFIGSNSHRGRTVSNRDRGLQDFKKAEQVVFSSEPSAALSEEMAIFRGDFFKIEYPKRWQKNERYSTFGHRRLFVYSIGPDVHYPSGVPLDSIGPLLSIEVEYDSGLPLRPDPEIAERWVTINNVTGVFSPGASGADMYYFVEGGLRYQVQLVTAFHYYGISKEQALLVLSTFEPLSP